MGMLVFKWEMFVLAVARYCGSCYIVIRFIGVRGEGRWTDFPLSLMRRKECLL